MLTPRPAARPRIGAYAIDDAAHEGQLKVGQTTRKLQQRVAEQLKTAAIANFNIALDEPAERDDGSVFTGHDVRAALINKGFGNVQLEIGRCPHPQPRSAALCRRPVWESKNAPSKREGCGPRFCPLSSDARAGRAHPKPSTPHPNEQLSAAPTPECANASARWWSRCPAAGA
jgi:hypothetical protein